MAKTVEQLQKEIAERQAELEEAMKKERVEALATVKELCKTYGFTRFDLRGALALTGVEKKEKKRKQKKG